MAQLQPSLSNHVRRTRGRNDVWERIPGGETEVSKPEGTSVSCKTDTSLQLSYSRTEQLLPELKEGQRLEEALTRPFRFFEDSESDMYLGSFDFHESSSESCHGVMWVSPSDWLALAGSSDLPRKDRALGERRQYVHSSSYESACLSRESSFSGNGCLPAPPQSASQELLVTCPSSPESGSPSWSAETRGTSERHSEQRQRFSLSQRPHVPSPSSGMSRTGQDAREMPEGGPRPRSFSSPETPSGCRDGDEACELIADVANDDICVWRLTSTDRHDLLLSIFEHIGLGWRFGLSTEVFRDLVRSIESHYQTKPFHSFEHAVDVTQAIFALIVRLPVHLLDHIDVLALLFAALVHDVDHDGRTNAFHVASRSRHVIAYGEKSVAENHHASLGRSLIEQSGLLQPLPNEKLLRFWDVFRTAILATDIARHEEMLGEFKVAFGSDWTNAAPLTIAQKELLGAVLLKCADLSNVARSLENNGHWAKKLQAEFFLQGDDERALGLKVSVGMDRILDEKLRTMALLKSQVFFISRFAQPLYEAFAAVFPREQRFADNVASNLAAWQRLVAASTIPS